MNDNGYRNTAYDICYNCAYAHSTTQIALTCYSCKAWDKPTSVEPNGSCYFFKMKETLDKSK